MSNKHDTDKTVSLCAMHQATLKTGEDTDFDVFVKVLFLPSSMGYGPAFWWGGWGVGRGSL